MSGCKFSKMHSVPQHRPTHVILTVPLNPQEPYDVGHSIHFTKRKIPSLPQWLVPTPNVLQHEDDLRWGRYSVCRGGRVLSQEI